MTDYSVAALAPLVVFLLMLWVPLGQQKFLAEHWMKVGAYLAPVLLFLALTTRPPDAGPFSEDTKLMATMLAAAYMLHQVEEHWIDLRGRIYLLRDQLNVLLGRAFGPEAASAMTPQAVFFINTSVVWLAAFIAIWSAPSHLFPAVALAGVIFVNGIAHIVQAVAARDYNPGLLTAIAIFVPLSVAFYVATGTAGSVRPIEIGAGIAWGIFAHVLLIGGLLAANVHKVIPVAAYYALLIGWGVLPALLLR
ncbi:MAG: HXXEE domain-containing protein [Pseudomonadota bacterium]